MKLVGIVLQNLDRNWMGGVNYFRSLVEALELLPEKKLTPIIIVAPENVPFAQETFPKITVKACQYISPRSKWRYVRLLSRFVFNIDLVLVAYLKRHNIKVISHGPALGKFSPIKSYVWIPDFQVLHLPELSTVAERSYFNKRVLRLAKDSTGIILSSCAAKEDLLSIVGSCESRVYTLHFTPRLVTEELISLGQLQSIYKIDSKFIFLPNQFWAHKNHELIILAAHLLKTCGTPVKIVCTGAVHDPRSPQHYNRLCELINEFGVEAEFKILGLVPYNHMLSMMYAAHAVINPSKFEGWSTSVEEAKAMGKYLLLSDIPVHREQVHERASFFPINDYKACANSLKLVWDLDMPVEKINYTDNLKLSSINFAKNYINIVSEGIKSC